MHVKIHVNCEFFKLLIICDELKKSSLVGLEPTTFELEIQCANPLRHRDLMLL